MFSVIKSLPPSLAEFINLISSQTYLLINYNKPTYMPPYMPPYKPPYKPPYMPPYTLSYNNSYFHYNNLVRRYTGTPCRRRFYSRVSVACTDKDCPTGGSTGRSIDTDGRTFPSDTSRRKNHRRYCSIRRANRATEVVLWYYYV